MATIEALQWNYKQYGYERKPFEYDVIMRIDELYVYETVVEDVACDGAECSQFMSGYFLDVDIDGYWIAPKNLARHADASEQVYVRLKNTDELRAELSAIQGKLDTIAKLKAAAQPATT